MKTFLARLEKGKVLLGVVHLQPLPGSPRNAGRSMDAILAAAKADAETILAAGLDGFILENFGDAPFHGSRVPPHVLTLMTRAAMEVLCGPALVGVNVLRNDARGALAVAAACGLPMIRVNVHTGAMVTDQGILQGEAAETVRERELLAPDVAILADVRVKHAYPLGVGFDLRTCARDTAYRGLADALIVTGAATGSLPLLDDVKAVREAVPDRPLLVGSGVSRETVREILRHADGIIVGTSIKRRGKVEEPVDLDRARDLVIEARR
jgi:hypothetical protein